MMKGSGLTTISVHKTQLTELDCSYNKLKTLKLPKTMETLDCSHNTIALLGLHDGIKYLNCSYNRRIHLYDIPETLKVLDISECCLENPLELGQTELEELSTTRITTLIAPETLRKLQLDRCYGEKIVFQEQDQWEDDCINIVGATNLVDFILYTHKVSELVLPETVQHLTIEEDYHEKLIIRGPTNLQTLRVSYLDSHTEIFNTLKELIIEYRYYSSTLDLENCRSLEKLVVRGYELVALDLPNSIRYLDVNECELLSLISIGQQQINRENKSFDFSNTSLTTLCCNSCKITELLIPKTLLRLECEENKLKTIEIHEGLIECDIYENKIDHIDSSHLEKLCCSCGEMKEMPVLGNNLKTLFLDGYDCGMFDISYTQITQLTLFCCQIKKTFFPKTLENIEIECSKIECLDFTGAEELQNVHGFHTSSIGMIVLSNSIVKLDCRYSDVKTIKFNGAQLTYMNCQGNQIQELSLPKTLISLYCGENPIKELSLPKTMEILECTNTKVDYLDISHTQISDLTFCNARVQKTLILNETISELTCDKIQKNIDLSKTKITRFIYKYKINAIRLPENIRVFHIRDTYVVCIGKKIYNSIGLLLKSSLKNNIEKLENNKEKNPFIRKHNIPKTKHHIHYLLSLRLLQEVRKDIRNLPDIGKD